MNWDTKIDLAHAVQEKQSHQGHHIGMIHPSDEGKELTSYISPSLKLRAKSTWNFGGNGCKVDFSSVESFGRQLLSTQNSHTFHPKAARKKITWNSYQITQRFGGHLKNIEKRQACLRGGNVTPPPPVFSQCSPWSSPKNTSIQPIRTPGHSVTERMGFFSGVVWAAFIACLVGQCHLLFFAKVAGSKIWTTTYYIKYPYQKNLMFWNEVSFHCQGTMYCVYTFLRKTTSPSCNPPECMYFNWATFTDMFSSPPKKNRDDLFFPPRNPPWLDFAVGK